MRIIAELHLDHWSARFADDPSPGCFGAPYVFAAIRRLLKNSHAQNLTLEDFGLDAETSWLSRVEMVLIDQDGDSCGDPCPDCYGTGKYVGLREVEPCRRCKT